MPKFWFFNVKFWFKFAKLWLKSLKSVTVWLTAARWHLFNRNDFVWLSFLRIRWNALKPNSLHSNSVRSNWNIRARNIIIIQKKKNSPRSIHIQNAFFFLNIKFSWRVFIILIDWFWLTEFIRRLSRDVGPGDDAGGQSVAEGFCSLLVEHEIGADGGWPASATVISVIHQARNAWNVGHAQPDGYQVVRHTYATEESKSMTYMAATAIAWIEMHCKQIFFLKQKKK